MQLKGLDGMVDWGEEGGHLSGIFRNRLILRLLRLGGGLDKGGSALSRGGVVGGRTWESSERAGVRVRENVG